MKIDYQRLRNLTTGRLHTEVSHIYKDFEDLIGIEGLFTHQLPHIYDAIRPWLKAKIKPCRFWDGEYDVSHTGEMNIEPMTDEEKVEFFKRLGSL